LLGSNTRSYETIDASNAMVPMAVLPAKRTRNKKNNNDQTPMYRSRTLSHLDIHSALSTTTTPK